MIDCSLDRNKTNGKCKRLAKALQDAKENDISKYCDVTKKTFNKSKCRRGISAFNRADKIINEGKAFFAKNLPKKGKK